MGHATIEIRAENQTEAAFRQTSQSLNALESQNARTPVGIACDRCSG